MTMQQLNGWDAPLYTHFGLTSNELSCRYQPLLDGGTEDSFDSNPDLSRSSSFNGKVRNAPDNSIIPDYAGLRGPLLVCVLSNGI
jgi:hypothetical protein